MTWDFSLESIGLLLLFPAICVVGLAAAKTCEFLSAVADQLSLWAALRGWTLSIGEIAARTVCIGGVAALLFLLLRFESEQAQQLREQQAHLHQKQQQQRLAAQQKASAEMDDLLEGRKASNLELEQRRAQQQAAGGGSAGGQKASKGKVAAPSTEIEAAAGFPERWKAFEEYERQASAEKTARASAVASKAALAGERSTRDAASALAQDSERPSLPPASLPASAAVAPQWAEQNSSSGNALGLNTPAATPSTPIVKEIPIEKLATPEQARREADRKAFFEALLGLATAAAVIGASWMVGKRRLRKAEAAGSLPSIDFMKNIP